MKKHQILIIGNNDNGCTPELEKVAYETGAEIAKSNSILITGGLGGVMKAASKGAKEFGGLTVGIIPQNDKSKANEFCDVIIPSGMGLMRDFLNALSSDGVIAVGGGSVMLDNTIDGLEVIKPQHNDLANAVGAAIAQVSGQVSKVILIDDKIDRESAIKQVTDEATKLAVDRNADPNTINVLAVSDMPLSYLPGNNLLINVTVVGDLKMENK